MENVFILIYFKKENDSRFIAHKLKYFKRFFLF